MRGLTFSLNYGISKIPRRESQSIEEQPRSLSRSRPRGPRPAELRRRRSPRRRGVQLRHLHGATVRRLPAEGQLRGRAVRQPWRYPARDLGRGQRWTGGPQPRSGSGHRWTALPHHHRDRDHPVCRVRGAVERRPVQRVRHRPPRDPAVPGARLPLIFPTSSEPERSTIYKEDKTHPPARMGLVNL